MDIELKRQVFKLPCIWALTYIIKFDSDTTYKHFSVSLQNIKTTDLSVRHESSKRNEM